MKGKSRPIAMAVTLLLLIQLLGCGKAESVDSQPTVTIEETEETIETSSEPSEAEETKNPASSEVPSPQPTEEPEPSQSETPAQQPVKPVDYSNISVEIGSYITFGHYEQDSVEADGTEPVEWVILDVAGNNALLLSRYVLDVQPYGDKTFITLDKWLNNDFYDAIFTEEEKEYTVNEFNIISDPYWSDYPWADYPESIRVDGLDGIDWGTYALTDTNHHRSGYLFLPSYAFAERYFPRYYDPTYSDPVAVLTDINASYTLYAQKKAREVNKSDYKEGWWMGAIGSGYVLKQGRGDGHMETYLEYTQNMYGLICSQHGLPQYGRCLPYKVSTYSGIRPALWVDLAVFTTDLVSDVEDTGETVRNTGTVFDIMEMSPEGYAVFGEYEQDNNLDNGPERLQWIVLAEEDGKLLLSTVYGIDVIEAKGTYDTKECWGTSELREWLNGDFYNTVFSDAEREYIALTTSTMEPLPLHQHTMDTTEDYVLLLTYNQSIQLDPDHAGANLEPTPYAIARGADVKQVGNGEYAKLYCKYWQTLGDLDRFYVGRVIRPAIWVNIVSE